MRNITRKYHLFDAQGKILGRLSTEIALILTGKQKIEYTPNQDGGDFVVVKNAQSIDVTGGKEQKKVYYRFTGYPGGLRSRTLGQQRERDATKIIRQAVYGMLPDNKLRNNRLKRLFIYQGDECPHKIDIEHNNQ